MARSGFALQPNHGLLCNPIPSGVYHIRPLQPNHGFPPIMMNMGAYDE